MIRARALGIAPRPVGLPLLFAKKGVAQFAILDVVASNT